MSVIVCIYLCSLEEDDEDETSNDDLTKQSKIWRILILARTPSVLSHLLFQASQLACVRQSKKYNVFQFSRLSAAFLIAPAPNHNFTCDINYTYVCCAEPSTLMDSTRLVNRRRIFDFCTILSSNLTQTPHTSLYTTRLRHRSMESDSSNVQSLSWWSYTESARRHVIHDLPSAVYNSQSFFKSLLKRHASTDTETNLSIFSLSLPPFLSSFGHFLRS